MASSSLDSALPASQVAGAAPSPSGLALPNTKASMRRRLRAAGAHLLLSLLVAAAAAALVFWLWYPMPYRELSGGRELFLLVVAVDVVMGPLITLAVFDTRKSWKELKRDLLVVCALQLAALGYGLYTVAIARPVVMALEGERLRVVRDFDLSAEELAKAPAALRRMPLVGITPVATREPRADEQIEAIQLGLVGVDIGARPQFWLPPEQAAAKWAAAAQPLSKLRRLQPGKVAELEAAIAATGKAEAQLKYLPIVARRTDFIALIDAPSGVAGGYAASDGH